jgi:hypothetical protein
MPKTHEAIQAELTKPFPPEVVQWRPGKTTQDKSRAMGLAYVESREYIRRLNDAAGSDWEDDYAASIGEGRVVVVCRLTVAGVTRTGDGECESTDRNAMTSASAQAFKRACVKHSLGMDLYDLPKTWADYDAGRKRFTDRGLAELAAVLTGGAPPSPPPAPRRAAASRRGGGNGNGGDPAGVVLTFGKFKGQRLGEVHEEEPGYVEWLADNAKKVDVRRAAAALLEQWSARPAGAPPF